MKPFNPRRLFLIVSLLAMLVGTGCVSVVRVVPPEERRGSDRSVVETPAGQTMVMIIDGLTAPTAMALDNEDGEHKGTILIAEGGIGGNGVRIFAFRPDDSSLETIYPRGRKIPFLQRGFAMYGPIGGMIVHKGKILVSHRDRGGAGVITALGYDGTHSTVVADLPAKGDYSVTDLAINPINGRLYFGVGAATNSGVVGLDNWQVGWVDEHPMFGDASYVALKLLGFRFDTKNPRAGLFGGSDIAVTAPFQPFNSSNQTRISATASTKPTSAIYSVDPAGGDLRVEAHGIRLPRGLAFNEYGQLFFTNNGMEMRGTRPVKDDPDALLRLSPGAMSAILWYGFPDFTTDFYSVNLQKYQPPIELMIKYGYPELAAVIDHRASGLDSPDTYRQQLLFGVFPSQSGAAKLEFIPGYGPLKTWRGEALVALSGDRAPFATSGQKLVAPVGRKVVRVDVDPGRRTVHELVRNTSGLPASEMGDVVALERPCDVRFAVDGSLYLLDMGRMRVVNGEEHVTRGTGRLFHIVPEDWAATKPATRPASRDPAAMRPPDSPE